MCGRQIAKKAVRVLHLILDYHQGSESSIVRGSGGCFEETKSQKMVRGKKKRNNCCINAYQGIRGDKQ